MTDPRELPATIETIPEALAFWAELTPDAPAVRALDGQQLSHGELQTAVCHVARRLRALGVQQQDRIALLAPSGLAASVVTLAAMGAAVAVAFNPAAPAHELQRDLQRISPRLLVSGGPSEREQRRIAATLGIATVPVGHLVERDHSPLPSRETWTPVDAESIAAILHTSGTSGLPKRVPRPHRTYISGARALAKSIRLTPADVLLLAIGLQHNTSAVNLIAALVSGGTCVVVPRFDPFALPDWIAAHQPTWIAATAGELNSFFSLVTTTGRTVDVGARTRLRLVRTGSQAMLPGTAEFVQERFGASVLEAYGMSEASYIAGNGPDAKDRRAGSCGRPLAAEVRILDEAGNEAPTGMTGEIVVRGPTLFPGYLDDPEANAQLFLPGGWFRTRLARTSLTHVCRQEWYALCLSSERWGRDCRGVTSVCNGAPSMWLVLPVAEPNQLGAKMAI